MLSLGSSTLALTLLAIGSSQTGASHPIQQSLDRYSSMAASQRGPLQGIKKVTIMTEVFPSEFGVDYAALATLVESELRQNGVEVSEDSRDLLDIKVMAHSIGDVHAWSTSIKLFHVVQNPNRSGINSNLVFYQSDSLVIDPTSGFKQFLNQELLHQLKPFENDWRDAHSPKK